MEVGIFASKFCELGMNVNEMHNRRDWTCPVFSNFASRMNLPSKIITLRNLAIYQIAGKMVNAGLFPSKFSRKIFPQIIIVGYTNV